MNRSSESALIKKAHKNTPTRLTNALMTHGRPLSVHTRVTVATLCQDVAMVTAREAQCSVPLVRASNVTTPSLGTWPEVEAVLRRVLPFTGAVATLIFVSVKK